MSFQKLIPRGFPGSPVVMTWCFQCWGPDSILGWGIKIPQAVQHGQKITKKLKLNNTVLMAAQLDKFTKTHPSVYLQ